MRGAARTRVCGGVLVGVLAVVGCDALVPARDEVKKEVAVAPVKEAAPAEESAPVKEGAPAKEVGLPVHRRPVEPGYLAPPTKAGTQPVEPGTQPVEVGTKTGEETKTGGEEDKQEWERLLDEAKKLSATGRWEDIGPARAKELEAYRAIRALEPSNKKYVEAQCLLAQGAHVGADVEAGLLGAIERLRAEPPADKYAHLDRDDLITTTIGAMIADDGIINLSPSNGFTSAGDCSRPDIALLTTLLIDSYHSYGIFKKAYPDVKPPLADPFKAASQALLNLHAELVREYGAKHARPAALVERFYFACHWSDRKRHPKICYKEEDERKIFEQALVAREGTYGEDHPLTRVSLLRVGAVRVAEGKLEEGGELLARAMAGELDSETKATAAAIVAMMALDAGKVDEGLALFGRIEAASDRIYGEDWWSHGAMLSLYSSALEANKRPVDALRVFKKNLAIQPAGPPGSKSLPWPGYAELLVAAGERQEALTEYERRIAYAVELEQTGANEPARQSGRDKRLADLRARAEVRRAVGDAAGADADLAEARRIEQGPPVPPDR